MKLLCSVLCCSAQKPEHQARVGPDPGKQSPESLARPVQDIRTDLPRVAPHQGRTHQGTVFLNHNKFFKIKTAIMIATR